MIHIRKFFLTQLGINVMYPFDVKMINAYCEVEKLAFLLIANFNNALLNYVTSPCIKTSDKYQHK